jgi:dienelactone hydrolase
VGVVRSTRRRRITALVVAAVVVVLLAIAIPLGWSAVTSGQSNSSNTVDGAKPIDSAMLGGSAPGSLISAMTMPDFDKTPNGQRLQSARVVYVSTEGDTGKPTEVSGSVFTPPGPAPVGGWPVVALAHGTLGIDNPCGPSLFGSLLGMADQISHLADQGYAVAFADYQGLGYDGVHPYLDARTAGFNVIDAVRALRHTFKDVSPRWAAFGGSQGGGASWAADEQASTYAPDLNLVGAVSISPAADVAGIVDKAQAATLTTDQRAIFEIIVESMARLHPDINRDDYRRGEAAQYWDVLTACSGPKVHERTMVAGDVDPHELAPVDEQAADRLRGYLEGWALPQRKLSAPMAIAYGGADTYVDSQWVDKAIARACQLGDNLTITFEPGKGHGDVDFDALSKWMADRFAGKSVTSGCP